MQNIFLISVNLGGLLLIGFVIWWFWLGKSSPSVAAANKNRFDIHVAGGVYLPGVLSVTVGQKVVLRFFREEENPCAAVVIFPDFSCSLELPIKQWVEMTLVPDKTGEYEFTCQMGMYRGKLIVSHNNE